MTDVVHVSFRGGGIFLPNEGPVDRQYVMEYVAHILQSKPQVQVLHSDQRWLVERCGWSCSCAHCGRGSTAVCRRPSNKTDAYCLRCALETEPRRPRKGSNPTGLRHLTLALAGT